MIVLKDEQHKVVGTAASMEEAVDMAWRIRGRTYVNPTITFHNEKGEQIGQYPPQEVSDG